MRRLLLLAMILPLVLTGCFTFFEKTTEVIPLFGNPVNVETSTITPPVLGFPFPDIWTALINSETVGNAAANLIDSVALNETRKPYAYQVIETQYWIRVGR